MKYLFRTAAVFSVFFWMSCQNTPASSSAAPASSDPNKLYLQVQEDFYAGRGFSHKQDSTYTDCMNFARSIKQSSSGLSPEMSAKTRQIFQGTMAFNGPFEEHRQMTDRLDSLSIRLKAGTIAIADAQKEYETVRATMKAAEAKMLESAKNISALKNEFQALFANANQQASGVRQ